MHMADALLSPAVGGTMYALSAGALAYGIRKIRNNGDEERSLPLMAVSGAFVFAAQMINFTIPGTGSSGHIGGGILLAGLLGGAPALLVISAVLLIQCLIFADGGLLALGANIFNMGVLPCLLVYPLLFRPILRGGITGKRLWLASVLSVVIGLQLGAFGVVCETLLSGVTALPFAQFALLMQPIHLAIGLCEGVITGAVLNFVWQARPELLREALAVPGKTVKPGDALQEELQSLNVPEMAEYGSTAAEAQQTVTELPASEMSGATLSEGAGSLRQRTMPMRRLLIIGAVCALLIGGGLSLYASAYPDGLEWSMERIAGSTELSADDAAHAQAARIQEQTALLPDYDFADGAGTGTSAAGILGSVMTAALVGMTGFALSIFRRGKKQPAA